MKKKYDSIDVTKFIGSILIFIMHCSAFSDYRHISFAMEVMARWGVPFFFICSSYFFFKSNTDKGFTHVIKYIYRIGTLYLLWFIYNIPNLVYQRVFLYEGLTAEGLSQAEIWLVMIKNAFFGSTFTGSWYLASSIFSVLMVYSLSKILKTETIVFSTYFLYILCVSTSVYAKLLPQKIADVLGFLCFPTSIFNGCFPVAIGKYFYENESRIIRVLTIKNAIIAFVVSYISLFLEIMIARYFNYFGSTDVGLSTVVTAISLFAVCLQTNIRIKNGLLLRKLSIIIFCCQANVLLINEYCKRHLGMPSIIAFLISVFMVVIISVIVLRIQKNTNWKWAKLLT